MANRAADSTGDTSQGARDNETVCLDEFKYLRDGSEPGWRLHKIDQTIWHLEFSFDSAGPSKAEIVALHKILPEFKSIKLPDVFATLRKKCSYRTKEIFGNIEARELYELSKNSGLNVNSESVTSISYLPISKDNHGLIIEDDHLAELVTAKMLEAGVEVFKIHIN